MSVYII